MPVIQVKKKRFKKKEFYSKYNKSPENSCQVNIKIFLTQDMQKKLLLATKLHKPKILRDFLMDNVMTIADRIVREHPELEEELYNNPEKYHPDDGEPNIFKPQMISIHIKKMTDGTIDGSTAADTTADSVRSSI